MGCIYCTWSLPDLECPCKDEVGVPGAPGITFWNFVWRPEGTWLTSRYVVDCAHAIFTPDLEVLPGRYTSCASSRQKKTSRQPRHSISIVLLLCALIRLSRSQPARITTARYKARRCRTSFLRKSRMSCVLLQPKCRGKRRARAHCEPAFSHYTQVFNTWCTLSEDVFS